MAKIFMFNFPECVETIMLVFVHSHFFCIYSLQISLCIHWNVYLIMNLFLNPALTEAAYGFKSFQKFECFDITSEEFLFNKNHENILKTKIGSRRIGRSKLPEHFSFYILILIRLTQCQWSRNLMVLVALFLIYAILEDDL